MDLGGLAASGIACRSAPGPRSPIYLFYLDQDQWMGQRAFRIPHASLAAGEVYLNMPRLFARFSCRLQYEPFALLCLLCSDVAVDTTVHGIGLCLRISRVATVVMLSI